MTPASTRHTDPATVLLADPEELVRWSLRERLTAEGHRVHDAATVAEALRHAAAVDVVLLDCRLPDLDGRRALRLLREAVPETPVIVMTAAATAEFTVEAMREGAHGCIRKPFDLDEVSAVVERAVETSRLRREVRALRALRADRGAACVPFRLPDGGTNLEDVERQLLVQALERSSWNQTRAGALLGINRDQVRYRIEKFGLTAPSPRTTLAFSPTR